ncbi:hypothetical protein HMI55_003653 [Coelomomyces lativittatus]|nr:hypothetical protein HMI55_003653 [Coelomomyces lativittatus]
MVVLNAYQKFTIHTLQHNRSIVLIRENSIHDGFGKYEKTTSMKLSKDFEGRQTGNKNGHAPLNQVNIKPGDGPMKLKNMTEGQKYLTTSTKDTKGFATPSTTKSMKMPTKTPIKTSTTKAPIVFTNQVPKENLKEETLKKKGNTKVKNNLPPSSKPFKSQEDLNYEEILKKRKRAVRQLWSSGQKIDFDKLGLGLDKVKRPTSNKNTGNIKTNLKKRQTGRNKYFELALTLGKIEEIEDPRHAEQYLADLVNLLQVYYIRHDFNGYSFRLSGTYYLEKHTELLGFSNLPAKNAYETFLERWKDFAEKLNFRSSDMKFFLPYRPNEKYDLIPDYGYSYINDDCSKEWAKGLAFITDLYITNLYEIAGTLTHELGHLSGMNHDGENSCNEAKFFFFSQDSELQGG